MRPRERAFVHTSVSASQRREQRATTSSTAPRDLPQSHFQPSGTHFTPRPKASGEHKARPATLYSLPFFHNSFTPRRYSSLVAAIRRNGVYQARQHGRARTRVPARRLVQNAELTTHSPSRSTTAVRSSPWSARTVSRLPATSVSVTRPLVSP